MGPRFVRSGVIGHGQPSFGSSRRIAIVVARRPCELGVTSKTVEHHVSNVLGKLGLRGRAEAAVYAMTLERADQADQNPAVAVYRPR